MNKKILLVCLLLIGVITFTGCEIKFKKDFSFSNKTTTTKEFTYKDAEEIILNKYYEEGVNTHYEEFKKT